MNLLADGLAMQMMAYMRFEGINPQLILGIMKKSMEDAAVIMELENAAFEAAQKSNILI